MILGLIFAHGFHCGLRHAAVGSLLPGHAVFHSLLRLRRIITDSLTADTYEPHKQGRCHFVRHLRFLYVVVNCPIASTIRPASPGIHKRAPGIVVGSIRQGR